MKFAYSNTQMRAADEAAIAAGTPVETLMERAGRALAEAMERAAQNLNAQDMLFVCGGGNNGGDGFVAARILAERGYEVAVLCLAERFSASCAAAKAQFCGEILGRIPRRRYALIADCLFGTGLDRAPAGDAAALIHFINDSGAYVVACDLPSGLNAGGIAFAPCVVADETVAMGQLKQALLLADGADTAGKITVADIGIPAECGAEIWAEEDVAAFFPKRKSHTNKGNYGTAAVLSTCNTLGAPLLAAGAALKSGAGYTDIYMTSASVPCEDEAKLLSLRMADEMHRVLCAAKYPACRFSFYDGEPIFADAVAFGMGAGVGEATRKILEELLSGCRGTLVLDADALNTLALFGADILKKRACPVVVTPHIKEFSRLTGRAVEEVLSDPVGLAQAFAREYGVTVVLKNNRTVITDGARTAINITGSPALAKGGSGDALAGFLAGTCARGVPPFEAACVAAYLMGRAGGLAAEALGEYAPDASDVIARLPAAMRELHKKTP